MKNSLLKAFITLAFMFGVFLLVPKAQAYSTYDQASSAYIDYSSSTAVSEWGTTLSNIDPSFVITSLTFGFSQSCTVHLDTTLQYSISATSTQLAGGIVNNLPGSIDQKITINGLNLSGASSYSVTFIDNNDGFNDNCYGGLATYITQYNNSYNGYIGALHGSVYPYTILNGANDFNISFANGFSNGMTTPDFAYWQVNVTMPEQTYLPNWEVEYAPASTSPWTWTDSFSSLNWTNNGAFNGVISTLKKSQSLPPGNYQALAVLLSNGIPKATSDNLYFTISTGTPIQTPGTFPIPTSSFTTLFVSTSTVGSNDLFNSNYCDGASWSVLGVDVGNGVCNLFAFLFIPGQGTINAYNALVANIETRAPFSYGYEIQQIIANSGTGTPASLPTYDIVASTSNFRIDVPILSTSTFAANLNSTNFGPLRDAANITLYVGFGLMVYYTAVGTARRKNK